MMRHTTLLTILSVLVASAVLALVAIPAFAGAPDTECPICQVDVDRYGSSLSQQEAESLLLALNDEYRAWAIYDGVVQDFGTVRPFTNIRASEANHIKALLTLFGSYGLPIPENPWIGSVPQFDSVAEACGAGAEAEIANFALYDQLLGSTERSDILTVYGSLQQASQEHHLPAFERCAR